MLWCFSPNGACFLKNVFLSWISCCTIHRRTSSTWAILAICITCKCACPFISKLSIFFLEFRLFESLFTLFRLHFNFYSQLEAKTCPSLFNAAIEKYGRLCSSLAPTVLILCYIAMTSRAARLNALTERLQAPGLPKLCYSYHYWYTKVFQVVHE